MSQQRFETHEIGTRIDPSSKEKQYDAPTGCEQATKDQYTNPGR
jgi:hypothetical protein